ncbi:MAG TPA: hypothetical protein VK335_29755, partial [Bryobacteraceae bacterium]|nr:hypothetical protein [Bryobacteraceae bacterium]
RVGTGRGYGGAGWAHGQSITSTTLTAAVAAAGLPQSTIQMQPDRLLESLTRVRTHRGEPNYFSPNPACRFVNAIGLPTSVVVPPDIPNSAIHSQTLLFSRSGLGEPLSLAE